MDEVDATKSDINWSNVYVCTRVSQVNSEANVRNAHKLTQPRVTYVLLFSRLHKTTYIRFPRHCLTKWLYIVNISTDLEKGSDLNKKPKSYLNWL